MKRRVGMIVCALAIFALVGCSNGESSGEKAPAETSVAAIMDAIKAQIVQDVKDAGNDDGRTDVEILGGYVETNVVDATTDDPFGQVFFERTELDQDLLAEGTMLQAMFNTNADEIIVLKAKDQKDAEALKASLQKELDAQIQTWEQYLPDQFEKVKNNVLKATGSYVLYATYDNVDAVEKIFDGQVK